MQAAIRGVPAWNRHSLLVIRVRIRNRYNNTNENKVGKCMHAVALFDFWPTVNI